VEQYGTRIRGPAHPDDLRHQPRLEISAAPVASAVWGGQIEAASGATFTGRDANM